MTDTDHSVAFADKWFSQDVGKTVDLGLLRAWLSENHQHEDPTGKAIVYSMDLDRWARKVAK